MLPSVSSPMRAPSSSPSTRKAYTAAQLQSALQWVNSKLEAPMIYTVGSITAEENRVCS